MCCSLEVLNMYSNKNTNTSNNIDKYISYTVLLIDCIKLYNEYYHKNIELKLIDSMRLLKQITS